MRDSLKRESESRSGKGQPQMAQITQKGKITKRTQALGAPVQSLPKNTKRTHSDLRSLCLLLFKIRNYQTKPMLDAPNIYLRNPRHPRLKPGPGFLPNEPSQL